MLLYRVAKCMYADDLSGTGARLYGGRWNSVGRAMVYMASSRALAALEALVHLPAAVMPDGFCIATIQVPDDIFEVDPLILPANWNTYPEPDILKRTGDFFLKENKHLLLKVPSAIVKEEFNYLLNPQHPQAAGARVLNLSPFTFDERLL